ncbi:MAG: OsmC family protein [Erysipelotrichaceae bacterium]
MASQVSARLHFAQGFDGTLMLREGEVAIGVQADQARPYDLLQAALAACLHSTFLEILEKKRLSIEFADYLIEGIKRSEVPTMLEEVIIHVTLPDGPNNEALEKSFHLATQYCSVFNTLAQVAKMQCDVSFKTAGE